MHLWGSRLTKRLKLSLSLSLSHTHTHAHAHTHLQSARVVFDRETMLATPPVTVTARGEVKGVSG